jgi:hypothetical protein
VGASHLSGLSARSASRRTLIITNSNCASITKVAGCQFQEATFGLIASNVYWKAGSRSKNWRTVSQGSKSLNNNWWDNPSILSIVQEVALRLGYWLRTVIEAIVPENGGIPRSENQLTVYASLMDGGQQEMIVDAWPEREIKEGDNRVKFGKQLCGTLLSVAMSPTTL